MPKGIMLDFGKVLVTFDRSRTNHKLSLHSPLSTEEINRRLWTQELHCAFERDGLTPLDFYRETVSLLKFRSTMNQELFEIIYRDMFRYNAAVEKVLELVRPEIPMVLVSNTNRIHWSFIETLPVITRFFGDDSKLALSFLAKARKPEKEILEFGLNLLHTKPSETIFIDDIAEYGSAFQDLGGNSIQFDCSNEPFSTLTEKLRAYGVLSAK